MEKLVVELKNCNGIDPLKCEKLTIGELLTSKALPIFHLVALNNNNEKVKDIILKSKIHSDGKFMLIYGKEYFIYNARKYIINICEDVFKFYYKYAEYNYLLRVSYHDISLDYTYSNSVESYIKLDDSTLWGRNLMDIINLLLDYNSKGKKVKCEFNGHMLYSDKVTIDSAYKLVTGKTKSEYDKEQEDYRKRLELKELEHIARIPALTKEWVEKGILILSNDKWALWENIVPIRLSDLYHGMELKACLDIVTILKTGDFEGAKKELENQGHSGASYGLVCSMVNKFADNGPDFINYLKEQDKK